jgi:hypothetical protein
VLLHRVRAAAAVLFVWSKMLVAPRAGRAGRTGAIGCAPGASKPMFGDFLPKEELSALPA